MSNNSILLQCDKKKQEKSQVVVYQLHKMHNCFANSSLYIFTHVKTKVGACVTLIHSLSLTDRAN